MPVMLRALLLQSDEQEPILRHSDWSLEFDVHMC